MAKQAIDIAYNDDPSSISRETPTFAATKQVLISWDDTTSQEIVILALQRAKERLSEGLD